MFLWLAPLALSSASAQSTPGFDISWWDISNGGGRSTGGSFTLTGTIGQPDGNATSTGGDFKLTGGFLHGSPANSGAQHWALY